MASVNGRLHEARVRECEEASQEEGEEEAWKEETLTSLLLPRVSEIVLRILMQAWVNGLHSRNQPVFSIGVAMCRYIARILAVIALVSCSRCGPPKINESCSGNCASGLVCIYGSEGDTGICRIPCTQQSDCPSQCSCIDQRSVSTRNHGMACEGGPCLPPP